MSKFKNPFLTKGYSSPTYFCDRENETKTIVEALQNNRNITLYGRRKLGKTALIKHIFQNFDKSYICIWADLLPAQNFSGMVNILANNIYTAIESNKSLTKKIYESFKTLRPVISYDELTGLPQVFLDTSKNKQLQKSFEGLIKLLKMFDKPVILALDEFQQILKFPENDTEAYLRTIIQDISEVSFIFSGSDQHILNQMFTSYDKPFYQMSQLIKLKRIDKEKYQEFIKHHFENGKKKIAGEEVDLILDWSNGITYYIQSICNRLYAKSEKSINRKLVLKTLNEILIEFEDSYYTIREMLTRQQWHLLKAIAKEGKVKRINSKAFMSKHGFFNASSINTTIKSLLKDQLIYKSIDEGEKLYEIQDIFLSKWLAKQL